MFSHSLEESPISDLDNKMDISEGTTASRDSPCFSPDGDGFAHRFDRIDGNKTALKSDQHILSTEIKNNFDNHNASDECEEIDEIRHSIFTINNKITPLNFGRAGAALTLVNKHPLMSPTTITPESQSPRKIVNYPDIIPEIEQFSDDLDIVKELHDMKMKSLSPEFFSDSDSEPDLSQYQASVEPSFQTVALISNSVYKTPQAHATNSFKVTEHRRKITVMEAYVFEFHVHVFKEYNDKSIN